MNTPAKMLPANHAWKIEESLDLYQVEAWGKGYFSINAEGHVVIRPSMEAEREIDLFEVVQGLKARDLHTPVVIRFSDILAHRLRHLAEAFGTAIAENDYRNRYAAVFPIKVNQQRLVVEEVYRYGKEFGFGLEVGSKPELLAVMSITEDAPDRIVVCNGFKDDSYIEAVIIAAKLGRTIIPVVENYEEIIDPEARGALWRASEIGVRVKLASDGAGRWRDSAGEKSKFGLFICEILDLHALLKERNMLDCLQLVHCHPGSQLQDIRRVKDAINELAHVYAELKIMGAGLEYIDIGGGLGVDYDGSGTNYESSMNYTLNEYASDVVYRIKSVCDARDVPHPMIVSESGRAIAAQHSLLVFDVLGASSSISSRSTGRRRGGLPRRQELPQPVRDLFDSYRSVNERRLVECYHDALQGARAGAADVQSGVPEPGVPRSRRAALLGDLHQDPRHLPQARSVPEELEDLEDMLSDIYFCNFSVFQSLPDSWAIGQLFPIMPIQRLGERPTRNAVLADITCDSDGKIDRFVHPRITKRTLEVHELTRRASRTTWRPSWSAPIRKPSGICTIYSATPMWCTSGCRMTAAGGSRRSSRATPPIRCSSIWSMTPTSCIPDRPGLRAGDPGRPHVDGRGQTVKRFYENELNGYAYLEVEMK